jgi:uncharacterized protein YaeQ
VAFAGACDHARRYFTGSGMAAKATVFKAELSVSDMDRHYYATHQLTLAMHPSETEERLMVRVLAFALNASERLAMGRGISSTEEEPELWARDLTGAIDLWIEVGQPDEQRLRKACGRAKEVRVYCYSGRSAGVWWQKCAATSSASRTCGCSRCRRKPPRRWARWRRAT